MDTFKAVIEFMIPIIGDLAAPAIAVIAAYAARRLAKFLSVQESEKLEAFVREKVGDGVAYAEQMGLRFARDRGELPDSAAKLSWALGFVQRELEASGIVDVGAGRIVELIESRLGDRDAPGDAIAAGDTLRRLHAKLPTGVFGGLLALLMVTTGCVNASQPDGRRSPLGARPPQGRPGRMGRHRRCGTGHQRGMHDGASRSPRRRRE